MIISESEFVKVNQMILNSNGFVSPSTGETIALPLSAKLLLGWFHGQMPEDGSPVVASREDLSRMTGISNNRLCIWLDLFEEHWLIETELINKPGTAVPVRAVVWLNPNIDLTND